MRKLVFCPTHTNVIKNMSMFNPKARAKSAKKMIAEIMYKESTYFIEHLKTNSWVKKDTPIPNESITTKDPNKALVIKTYAEALNWCNERGVGKYNGWDITEHEF